MKKRRLSIYIYIIFIFAYLCFLLYFLTIQPGGINGNPVVVKALIGFASGGMMMMAIYAVTLYLFRHGEKAVLYFVLTCAGSGVRFLVLEGEANMILTEILPGLSYHAAFAINIAMVGLLTIGVVGFIFEIFAPPRQKKRLPLHIATLLVSYAIASIFVFFMGDGVMPVRIAIFVLTYFHIIYITVLVFRSPDFRTGGLVRLYFFSMVVFLIVAVFNTFLVDRFPNIAVISNSMFVIAHIILLSERYSRTISDNEMLAKLNRTKTIFLQDMSHEMKVPLTVIATGIDYADARIGEENIDVQETRAALGKIRNETQRLGRMVGGMVDLAAMSETGANRERVDFAALLRNGAEAFRVPLEQRNNRLRVEIAPGLPDVFVEADRFMQVMSNLFSNAANHTQNGMVTLSADFGPAYITVRLSDEGGGISPELLPRVFERGVSGSGGTGYGLYICRTIVEAHGGTITIDSPYIESESIESEPGKGTVVTFTVPVYGGQEAGHKL